MEDHEKENKQEDIFSMTRLVFLLITLVVFYGAGAWANKSIKQSQERIFEKGIANAERSSENKSTQSVLGETTIVPEEQLPQPTLSPEQTPSQSPETTPLPSQKVSEIQPAPAKEEEVEAAGASKKEKLDIIDRYVSWGFEKSSKRLIDTIIIHSTYNASGGDFFDVEKIIGQFKEYGVSAHYLVDRDGNVFRLVSDNDVAFHAGVSNVPDGRSNVNDFSIGIEMVNTQDGRFSSTQYDSLKSLVDNLKKEYSIKYVLGHKDIAPGRKTDPWNFDWEKLK